MHDRIFNTMVRVGVHKNNRFSFMVNLLLVPSEYTYMRKKTKLQLLEAFYLAHSKILEVGASAPKAHSFNPFLCLGFVA